MLSQKSKLSIILVLEGGFRFGKKM